MDSESQRQLDAVFLKRAVELSLYGIENKKGGPFGCVVVQEDRIVGEGFNQVTSLNDPSAHAQVMAIRDACKNIGTFHLKQCTIYTSCEPCPMCLGAIYWSNAKRVVFANTRQNAADINFDDKLIYDEIGRDMKQRRVAFDHVEMTQALDVFKKWAHDNSKTHY